MNNKNVNFQERRKEMVEKHLKARDISDEDVLEAMSQVPREKFVPKGRRDQAYSDHPVDIGHGQTISQPYIVAYMCQILDLKKDEKVLDIGTGLGYEAAVLSNLVDEVVSVEIIEDLAKSARERLNDVGYDNVEVVVGDGREGYDEKAPYDAIKVAAATRKIPQAWKDQLKVGGRMVLPFKSGRWGEDLIKVTKTQDGFEREELGAVAFVPLKKGE
jgi:protein-L-isoaspartate(D-aspartate) O-methyltransferase